MNNLLAFTSALTEAPRHANDKIRGKRLRAGRHCGHSHHRGLVGGHGGGLRPRPRHYQIIPMTIAFGYEEYAEGVDLSREPSSSSASWKPTSCRAPARSLPWCSRTSSRRPSIASDDRRGASRFPATSPAPTRAPASPRPRSRSRSSWSTARTPPSASVSSPSAPGPCAMKSFPPPTSPTASTRRRRTSGSWPPWIRWSTCAAAAAFPGAAAARGRHALHQARGGRRRWRRRCAGQGPRIEGSRSNMVFQEIDEGRRHRLHAARSGWPTPGLSDTTARKYIADSTDAGERRRGSSSPTSPPCRD